VGAVPAARAAGDEAGGVKLKRHHLLLAAGLALTLLAWLAWTMMTVSADLSR
jgi:hypothetical protein